MAFAAQYVGNYTQRIPEIPPVQNSTPELTAPKKQPAKKQAPKRQTKKPDPEPEPVVQEQEPEHLEDTVVDNEGFDYRATRGIYRKLNITDEEVEVTKNRFRKLRNDNISKRSQLYYNKLNPSCLEDEGLRQDLAVILAQREHASAKKRQSLQRNKPAADVPTTSDSRPNFYNIENKEQIYQEYLDCRNMKTVAQNHGITVYMVKKIINTHE